MKYLYAYECEKKALSSPAELQAAIDGNRREGRRPSYSSSLFGYSPSVTPAATRAPALLSTPKIRFPILGLGSNSGTSASNPRISPATALRKGLWGSGRREEWSQVSVGPRWEGKLWVGLALVPLPGDGVPVTTVPVPNRLAVPVTLAGQQAGTRMATLEQLRERLESGEPPEKKASKLSEEEQRLVQQAFQRNFFSMARQLPVKIRVNGRGECRAALHPGPIHNPQDWDEGPGGQKTTRPLRAQSSKLGSLSRGPETASDSALLSSKKQQQCSTGRSRRPLGAVAVFLSTSLLICLK